MRNKYAGRRGPRGGARDDDPFVLLKLWLPPDVLSKVRLLGESVGVSAESMATRILFNAITKGKPDIDIDLTTYTDLYVQDATKDRLEAWLQRLENGIDMDMLVICCVDAGMFDRETLLHTVKALAAEGRVKVFNDGVQRMPVVQAVNFKRLRKKKRYRNLRGVPADKVKRRL